MSNPISLTAQYRAVFLDRDGTINVDVDHLRRREDFRLLPGSAAGIRSLNEHGFRVVVVTNQSVIGRGWCDVAEVEAVHALMREQLAAAGAWLDAIYYCPHHPDEGCACRKPQTTFYRQAAAAFDIDFGRSWAVGDRWTDLEARLGAGDAHGAGVDRIRAGAIGIWRTGRHLRPISWVTICMPL